MVKVNVDENPGLVSRFDIMGIPTMILFKNGEAVDSFSGAMSKQALADKVSPYL
ncbi:MAG TPA: thioredoxin family protein [Bacillota bacterium]|nr:thioredoxin family protein [Bacillota bacterium]